MNIIISGAGVLGRHAAEQLGADGNNITVIDRDPTRLETLEQALDVRTVLGNGTHASVLREARCDSADLYLAAMSGDETNILGASIASSLGVGRSIARVHHSVFFEQGDFDYANHLGIDHLLCPEYTTALEIAKTLRNPGSLAVEHFGHGQVEMQQMPVSDDAPAIGRKLTELGLPSSTRLASVERGDKAFLPDGTTTLRPGDIITVIAETNAFEKARKFFHTDTNNRRKVMIMGGTPMGVWLCRALKSRAFSVRLYESDPVRAEELAAKLDWVTVVKIDPLDPTAFDEDRIEPAQAFVTLSKDDEQNILSAALAKSKGARNAIALLNQSTYMHLVKHVGIDRVFSPRITAVNQIKQLLDNAPVRQLAQLADGVADVFELRATSASKKVLGQPLKDIEFPSQTTVAAVQRGDVVHVPGAMDEIEAGDTLVLIAPNENRKALAKLFSLK